MEQLINQIDALLPSVTGVNEKRLQRIRTLAKLKAHISYSDKQVLKFNGVKI